MNLLVVFQCIPINASWNPTVVGQCIHLNTAFIIFGSLNALTGKGGYEMMKEQLTLECKRSHCLMPTHAGLMAASNRQTQKGPANWRFLAWKPVSSQIFVLVRIVLITGVKDLWR